MQNITTIAARKNFSDLLNRTYYRKDRTLLSRNGKAIAAVVPLQDLKLLEELEDRFDSIDGKMAQLEHERSGEPYVSFEQLLINLGIDASELGKDDTV